MRLAGFVAINLLEMTKKSPPSVKYHCIGVKHIAVAAVISQYLELDTEAAETEIKVQRPLDPGDAIKFLVSQELMERIMPAFLLGMS